MVAIKTRCRPDGT